MKRILTAGASCAAICAVTALYPQTAFAQGVGQRSDRDEIIVLGARTSLTAPDAKAARDVLERIPGGVGLVEADVFLDDFAQSIGDALLFTPGVFADTSAQRETRISIRGSGLNATFERRGITVRRDGVPISRASGITEFQEVDPLTIDYIEVFKGANGLEYGAASLGGAVNIVTPTGRTQEETATLRAEGGPFNTFRTSGSLAFAGDKWDFYGGVTALRSDGFRDHSDVRSVYGHSNIGYKFDNGAETRVYLTALSDNFELAGSLSFEDALENPTAAGAFVEIDDWDRNLNVVRLANKTVIPFDGFNLETGAWCAFRDLDHAITRFAGVIIQQENEVGGFVRLTGDVEFGGRNVAWLIGTEVAASDNDARQFENVFGSRGDLDTRSDQDARNILVYGQASVSLTDDLTAVVGAQYLNTLRDSDNILNAVDGRVTESQVNPRFGLLWDAGESAQVFFNVNRGFEPAGLSDLTAGGVLDFTSLEAQQAWTVEVGTRGQQGPFAWDLAFYRSWVENEFIDLAQPQFGGFVSATFNAEDTIHQGVEVGLDVSLTPKPLKDAGFELVWRNAYTFNDFFFTSNPRDLDGQVFDFDGNQLAGAPRHVYVSELRLEQGRWYATANFRWVPDGPFADFANALEVPGYELLGFTAGFDISEHVRVFASGENLTDEVYISNVQTIADRSLQPDARVFTPGQGRAFFGGLSVSF